MLDLSKYHIGSEFMAKNGEIFKLIGRPNVTRKYYKFKNVHFRIDKVSIIYTDVHGISATSSAFNIVSEYNPSSTPRVKMSEFKVGDKLISNSGKKYTLIYILPSAPEYKYVIVDKYYPYRVNEYGIKDIFDGDYIVGKAKTKKSKTYYYSVFLDKSNKSFIIFNKTEEERQHVIDNMKKKDKLIKHRGTLTPRI